MDNSTAKNVPAIPVSGSTVPMKLKSTLDKYVEKADQRKKVVIDNVDDLMRIVRDQFEGAAVAKIEAIAKEDLGAAIYVLQNWQQTGDVLYEIRSRDLEDMKETNAIRDKLYNLLGVASEDQEPEEYDPLLSAVHGFNDGVSSAVLAVSKMSGKKKSRNMIVDAIVRMTAGNGHAEKSNDKTNFLASQNAFFAQDGKVEQLLKLLIVDDFAADDEQSPFDRQADILQQEMATFMTNDLLTKEGIEKELTGKALEIRRTFLSRRVAASTLEFVKGLAMARHQGLITSLTSQAIFGVLSVSLEQKDVDRYKKFKAHDFMNVLFIGDGPEASCYVRIVTNLGEVVVFNPYTHMDSHGKNMKEGHLEKMIPDIRTIELCRVDDVVQLLEDLPEGMQLNAVVHDGNADIEVVIAGQPGKDVTLKAKSGKTVKKWHVKKGATDARVGADETIEGGSTLFRDLVCHLNPGFVLEISGANERARAITGQIKNGNGQEAETPAALPAPESETAVSAAVPSEGATR